MRLNFQPLIISILLRYWYYTEKNWAGNGGKTYSCTKAVYMTHRLVLPATAPIDSAGSHFEKMLMIMPLAIAFVETYQATERSYVHRRRCLPPSARNDLGRGFYSTPDADLRAGGKVLLCGRQRVVEVLVIRGMKFCSY